ncbi:NADH-quinone oxidoreductase subunit N [Seleniivibrio woodruffii]|uniref:NADH-quinone oxidoreductase subunit N n=1 Tax=Seleniivibrio woodruffii TaxID=1078050 RepID=A0A4R1KAP3_9BACT|nr:NADH-quinone oxidoreductase subunit N [Seleniivibrio woodruffii]TCK61578.1 NADH dehydrogenase subunit N [Seleniivibrio woodruffii]TVZ35307.1 NADH dehydrogenase subunit N [Seleniivibrio woodruffii]
MDFMLNLQSIFPEVLMTVFGLILVVLDVMTSKEKKSMVGYFGIAFLLITALVAAPPVGGKYLGFNNMLMWDTFSYVFFVIFALAYTLTTLGSVEYLRDKGILKGEFYTIMFFSILGMMFMVSAFDLTIFYVGLETMAIAMYVLAGFNKNEIRSAEAGVKYFIIGAFSSALFLFGMTYVYGATGSLNYIQISEVLQSGMLADNMTVKIGLILMLVGFAFKISAVPFHMWAPDVYQGAPTPAAGFMTVAPKAAAFAALVRFAYIALEPAAGLWVPLFSILAVLTMTYGNLVALAQTNVKRMLAYSAISHAGYMLIGLVSMNPEGYRAIALYSLIYVFMNIGAFTLLGILKNKGMVEDERLESFSGLAKKNPLYALAMLIFMFSLAGIPPLAGFIGKFQIFMAAMKADLLWLAIVGALNSALACYYYMRVTIYMYFNEPEYEVDATVGRSAFITSFIGVLVVLIVGFFPSAFINFVKHLIV